MIVNGKRTNVIEPFRGLRQGDPLSPYLFIIVTDVLSRMLDHKVRNKELQGIKPRGTCPEIHHLLFAYDSMFFIKVSVSNAQALKQTLDLYCKVSGQKVNFKKSSIYWASGSDQQVSSEVAEIFGMRVSSNPGKYLGKPSI